jgi:hypothetical protein
VGGPDGSGRPTYHSGPLWGAQICLFNVGHLIRWKPRTSEMHTPTRSKSNLFGRPPMTGFEALTPDFMRLVQCVHRINPAANIPFSPLEPRQMLRGKHQEKPLGSTGLTSVQYNTVGIIPCNIQNIRQASALNQARQGPRAGLRRRFCTVGRRLEAERACWCPPTSHFSLRAHLRFRCATVAIGFSERPLPARAIGHPL